MRTSIFLSYPKPSYQIQVAFLERVRAYLDERGFYPLTLGVTDYDSTAPLAGIRRLMIESNGLIAIAFRRTYVAQGAKRHGTDLPGLGVESVDDSWLTTPWSHIEAAMAFQLGLPIVVFKEEGVIADGLLERGVAGLYVPEFDLTKPLDDYFAGLEWNSIMTKWEGRVRAVVNTKGRPPTLYQE
jgi:hypothetical protein